MGTVTFYFSDGSSVGRPSYRNVNYSFKPGDRCKVDPLSAGSKHHAGKIGTLTDRSTRNHKVYMKFDNGGYGAVDISCLIPESSL